MKKKERKLSKGEQKRLAIFESKADELQSQGYKMQKLIISPFKANVFSFLITLPFVFVEFFLFLANMKNEFTADSLLSGLILGYILFIISIFLHELTHGITWAIYCKQHWKSISFGFNVAALAPYCSCSETLTKSQYIIGALMPTLLLGFLIGIVSICTGSFALLMSSAFCIIGGGGDFLMIINILKFKTDAKEILYYDHPTEIGTIVFYK